MRQSLYSSSKKKKKQKQISSTILVNQLPPPSSPSAQEAATLFAGSSHADHSLSEFQVAFFCPVCFKLVLKKMQSNNMQAIHPSKTICQVIYTWIVCKNPLNFHQKVRSLAIFNTSSLEIYKSYVVKLRLIQVFHQRWNYTCT